MGAAFTSDGKIVVAGTFDSLGKLLLLDEPLGLLRLSVSDFFRCFRVPRACRLPLRSKGFSRLQIGSLYCWVLDGSG